jgi:hypothetical protein
MSTRHGLIVILLMLNIALSGVFSSRSASAMHFAINRLPGGFHFVSATGAIVAGDAERLRSALHFADRDRRGNKNIALSSDGGRVKDALAMASVMDKERVATYVLSGTRCASACAEILFLSGFYRSVLDGGLLGLHSCSIDGLRSELCNEQIELNAVMHGVSYGSLLALVEQQGSSEVVWLDAHEADCWGLTLWPPEYGRGVQPGEPPPCVIKASATNEPTVLLAGHL